MGKQKTKNASPLTHPVTFIIIGVVLISVLAGGAYVRYHHKTQLADQTNSSKNPVLQSINNINYNGSSSGDNNANDTRKSSSSPSTTLNSSATSSNSGSTLSAKIISANPSGGNIHIGTQVSGSTTGTCTITATQGQTTVTIATADVKQDVNSYDCGGGAVNASTSQLSSGTWQLTLTVVSDSSQATDTTSITI